MYIKSPNVLKLCNATSYVPLIITQQPLGGFASETGTFSFNIKLIGSRPFTFNWYKDDILIPNQNSNVLTITNATSSDTAVYYCEINNNRFSKKTNSIKLGVISYLNIVKQPSEVVTKANTTINFNMSAVDPTINVDENTLTYSWYKNDKLVYTSSSTNFYLFNVQYTDEGEYYGVAYNLLNSITSNRVNLSLYRPLEITKFPTDIVIASGKTVNKYLSCTGTMPMTAQWRKNGLNYGNKHVENYGKSILVIPNVKVSSTGYYDCVLTNIVGTITSNRVFVYVFNA